MTKRRGSEGVRPLSIQYSIFNCGLDDQENGTVRGSTLSSVESPWTYGSPSLPEMDRGEQHRAPASHQSGQCALPAVISLASRCISCSYDGLVVRSIIKRPTIANTEGIFPSPEHEFCWSHTTRRFTASKHSMTHTQQSLATLQHVSPTSTQKNTQTRVEQIL